LVFNAISFLLAASCIASGPPVTRNDPGDARLERKNGKPVYDVEVTFIVPGTLEAMATDADEIVEGQIRSSEVRWLDQAARVSTFYNLTVSRAYKGSIKAGSSLEFSQFTGEYEFPDKIIRAAGFPALTVGDRYILFLHHDVATGNRFGVGDASGMFAVRNGRMQPQTTADVALAQRDLTEKDFRDRIKRVLRQAKPKA
jgi:hypothetical protein